MANFQLPKDVAEKYKLVGWPHGDTAAFGDLGTINITKITMAQADRLFNKNCPFLTLKKKSASADTKKETTP